MLPHQHFHFDSSYDSEMDIDEVKERYKSAKMDSARADLDRQTSFVAYANDNLFHVPQEGENDRDFKIDHFFDEPSPDLFADGIQNIKLGVRRPRALSLS